MNTLPPFYSLPTEQREAMLFIVEHIKTKGISPSFAEIAQARGRMEQAVCKTIMTLVAKGWVTTEKRTARSIALTEKALQEIEND